VGYGDGVSPSSLGKGAQSPSPVRKNFGFRSQYGEFWCVLGGIFVAIQLPVLHTKRYNLVPLPIIFTVFFASNRISISSLLPLSFSVIYLLFYSRLSRYGEGGLP